MYPWWTFLGHRVVACINPFILHCFQNMTSCLWTRHWNNHEHDDHISCHGHRQWFLPFCSRIKSKTLKWLLVWYIFNNKGTMHQYHIKALNKKWSIKREPISLTVSRHSEHSSLLLLSMHEVFVSASTLNNKATTTCSNHQFACFTRMVNNRWLHLSLKLKF